MALRVELIYDHDCPNVAAARAALVEAFAQAGLPAAWTEWDRSSPESPEHTRCYGSPTILVDERDVDGAEPAGAVAACRVYSSGAGGLQGVPPPARIVAALRRGAASRPPAKSDPASWWRIAAALPGAGAALIPVGLCPLCWPAYAGLLGVLGLGAAHETTTLLPLIALLLALALLPLGFGARRRRGYAPLVLGAASAAAILVFKFASPTTLLVHVGLVGLLAASVWNAWLKPTPGRSPLSRLRHHRGRPLIRRPLSRKEGVTL